MNNFSIVQYSLYFTFTNLLATIMITHNAKVRISIGFLFGFDSHFSSWHFLFVNFRKMFSSFASLLKKKTNQYIFFLVNSVAIWMDYTRLGDASIVAVSFFFLSFFVPTTHFLFAFYCALLFTCFYLIYIFFTYCRHCTNKSSKSFARKEKISKE